MKKITTLLFAVLLVSCTLISTKLAMLYYSATPINEGGIYEGYPLGLGTTPAHRLNAPRIRPINNKVIMVSIGASLPNQVSERFEERTAELTNPYFNFVNLCQPAKDVNDWINDPAIWTEVDNRLNTAGVLYNEVQIAWLQTDLLVTDTATFPDWPIRVQDSIEVLILKLNTKFPKLKQLYVSGRFYTGWSVDIKHTEPKGYYNGFSLKWLVENQIATGYPVKPWICDDIYFWTDQEMVRADGFQVLQSDFKTDGIHFTSTGKQKYGDSLFNEFLYHPVASKYFY